MENNLEQRLVTAFEAIARSLQGIHESSRTAISKHWPEPTGPREPIFSKVESEEERIKKAQGVSDKPLSATEWLSEPFGGEDDEPIGEREREFLERKRASSSKANTDGGQGSGGAQEAQGEAGSTGEGSTDQPALKES